MNVEEGKFYRTRDGEKVGPMGYTPYSTVPWVADGERSRAWHKDGRRYTGACTPGDDLIAEWTDEGPVRTRTVAEIVPGDYGRVRIVMPYEGQHGSNGVGIRLLMRGGSTVAENPALNAAELRDTAAVFVRLADALEGGAE